MRPVREPMKTFLYIRKPLKGETEKESCLKERKRTKPFLMWGYKHTPLEWTDTPLPFFSKGKNFQVTWRKICGLILACKGFTCKKDPTPVGEDFQRKTAILADLFEKV